MDHKSLTQAWTSLEKTLLAEGKKHAPKKVLVKKEVTNPKKIEEEGEMVTTTDAAPYKERLGRKVKKVNEAIKDDAMLAAKTAVNNVKSGKANTNDATIVGSIVSEKDTDKNIDPSEVDAAVDATAELPIEGDDLDDVSVDAEAAEQVVKAIQQKYPGAIITLSVKVPTETPFDTDLVAAAQEINGDDMSDLDDESVDDTVGSETDKTEEMPLAESRKKLVVTKRKKLKEMFDSIETDDDTTTSIPEIEADADSTDINNDELKATTVVSDTEISLTPEQWGKVLVTADLLNDSPAEEAGAEQISANHDKPIVDPEKDLNDIAENNMIMDEPIDTTLTEGFSKELALYANSLNKLIRE